MEYEGMIQLDSEFGAWIGFVSTRFDGYLWKTGNSIYLSVIESIEPNKGHFKQLLQTIREKGFTIKIPTPLELMGHIIIKWGFKPSQELFKEIESYGEVWVLKPDMPSTLDEVIEERNMEVETKLACSFCDKDAGNVRFLIKGSDRSVCICDGCVRTAVITVRDHDVDYLTTEICTRNIGNGVEHLVFDLVEKRPTWIPANRRDFDVGNDQEISSEDSQE